MVYYKYTKISSGKQLQLIKEYQNTKDKDVLDKIIEQNYYFVVKIAKKYYASASCSPLYEFDDIIGQGILGVIEAVNRFDTTMENKFLTYAGWWIRQYMTRFIYKSSTDYYMPPKLSAELGKYISFIKSIGERQEAKLSFKDISEKLNIPEGHIVIFQSFKDISLRLDSPIKHDQSDCDSFCDLYLNIEEEGYKNIERENLSEYLLSKINLLPDKQKIILIKQFGLDGNKPMTLREIGRDENISHECVRQLSTKAKRKLKKLLLEDGYINELMDY